MNGSGGDAGFRTTGGAGRAPMGAKAGGPSSGRGRTGGLPGDGAKRNPGHLPGMVSHKLKVEILTLEAEPGLVV